MNEQGVGHWESLVVEVGHKVEGRGQAMVHQHGHRGQGPPGLPVHDHDLAPGEDLRQGGAVSDVLLGVDPTLS